MYLGVVAIDGEPSTAERSTTDVSGRDVAVEMRRMPDDRRLTAVVWTATATDCVDRIADALVEIHRRAPSSPDIDRAGSPEVLLELWDASLDEMRGFSPSILDGEVLGRIAGGAHAYVAGRAALFEQRIADGRMRDGHGDLLADDVFCLDDGPRFLDCLEFDDRLRFGDVLADVAFLAMDLERVGRRDLSERLLERYRRRGNDAWPLSLADFYVAYRAVVRSKVACLRVGAGDTTAKTTARRLLALADEHLRRGRMRLILVGGPPASGKTTLACELARRTGHVVLHSDEVRKELAGLDPTTSAADDLDSGLYTGSGTRGPTRRCSHGQERCSVWARV